MPLVLRRIYGTKREEVTRKEEEYTTRRFIICTPQLILFG